MRSAVIWLLDMNQPANQLPDDERDGLLACLSPAELSRYQRFLRPLRQREFLSGRILLRFAVARQAGLAFDAVNVIEREQQAPLVQLPASCVARPQFSLSHSRGWVACATSADTALGVDIEALDGERDIEAIGRTAFSAAENDWLSQRPASDKVADFYALWCNKEALFKLKSGEGDEAALPELVTAGTRLQSGPEWHARNWLQEGFAISLCSRDRLSQVDKISLRGATPSVWLRQLRN